MNHTQHFCFVLFTLALSSGSSGWAQAAGTPIFINEIHYDNVGTDSGEAIEIAGPAGSDLTGWSLVLYNGNGGSPYSTTLLSGVIGDQSGNGFGTLKVDYPVNGIQNGSPDGIALVDAGNSVVQFLTYEGSFTAVGGPADGLAGQDIGVAESSSPVGLSLQLMGSGTQYEDFTWNTDVSASFGELNAGQRFSGDGGGGQTPVSQCGQPYTLISAIQGVGASSPLAGSVQHIEAVVTANFQGSGNLSGFFVQQPETDADPSTSEGLFIYGNTPVNVGDRVHVVGSVTE